jgi:hypothetical protein
MNKWGCIKIKSFCATKENSHWTQETAHRMGEKSLPATHLIRHSIPEPKRNSINSPPKNLHPNEEMGLLKGRGTNGQ